MAMARVFIREANLLRAEQNRNGARTEMFANCASARFEAPQRMLQVTVTNGRGADYERAVGHSIGDGRVFLGVSQDLSAAHGGARLAKGAFERIHHSQVRAPEVAHRAGSRADVQRISRRNENHAQAVEFAGQWHGVILCQYRSPLSLNSPHAIEPNAIAGGRLGRPNYFFATIGDGLPQSPSKTNDSSGFR